MTNKKQTERVEFSPVLTKKLANAPTEIKLAFKQVLDIFGENPNHDALRNHLLTGKYAGIHSIDVTEDWRALYREERERLLFVNLGTHDELYG